MALIPRCSVVSRLTRSRRRHANRVAGTFAMPLPHEEKSGSWCEPARGSSFFYRPGPGVAQAGSAHQGRDAGPSGRGVGPCVSATSASAFGGEGGKERVEEGGVGRRIPKFITGGRRTTASDRRPAAAFAREAYWCPSGRAQAPGGGRVRRGRLCPAGRFLEPNRGLRRGHAGERWRERESIGELPPGIEPAPGRSGSPSHPTNGGCPCDDSPRSS